MFFIIQYVWEDRLGIHAFRKKEEVDKFINDFFFPHNPQEFLDTDPSDGLISSYSEDGNPRDYLYVYKLKKPRKQADWINLIKFDI